MNNPYKDYPSNNRIKKLRLSPAKDPSNTFIGGIFVATALGYIVLSALIALHIL